MADASDSVLQGCPVVVTRTYTVTDACGNASTAAQTITIEDTTGPVIAGSLNPATVQGCDAGGAPAAVTTVAALEGLGVTITDACTADANLTVSASDAGAEGCTAVVTRTRKVEDGCGLASTTA